MIVFVYTITNYIDLKICFCIILRCLNFHYTPYPTAIGRVFKLLVVGKAMEIMKKAIRIIDGIFALCLIIIYSFIVFGNIVLPDKIEAYSTKKIEYKSVYSVENNSSYLVDYQNNSKVSPIENDIKLLGIIPVKTTSIIQSKPKKVSVSGESFGIKLYTDGVIIVGIRDVETDKGKCNPAKEAGLEKGDIIIEINGKKVYSADSVTDILNDNNGKDYKITVKRNGNYKEFLLKPAYSSSQGATRLVCGLGIHSRCGHNNLL